MQHPLYGILWIFCFFVAGYWCYKYQSHDKDPLSFREILYRIVWPQALLGMINSLSVTFLVPVFVNNSGVYWIQGVIRIIAWPLIADVSMIICEKISYQIVFCYISYHSFMSEEHYY